ncbi:angiopoietin-related protein 6 [Aplysia californica]|uniref:Angiopoietin-related protein 6 n=1 Tax=Aplysia californica TaxID=6500 RepID=A0ABM0JV67_APLCA|nr:angiopoietin-related protein 6 [Aplysia californica]
MSCCGNKSFQAIVLVACVFVLIAPAPSSSTVAEHLNAKDKTDHVDCHSLMKAGYNVSGVYRLKLNLKDVSVPCEFRGGNAYALILQRVHGSISFTQSWGAYETGFGSPSSDYWIGLATIYALTLQGNNKLQINTQDWSGTAKNGLYNYFSLEERNTRYRLHVGGYHGTLIDDLSYHNNMPFSTVDAPDPYGCAAGTKAGWWYNYCAYALPTGIYYIGGPYRPSGSMYDGIYWKDWHGYDYSLKYISMTLSH